MEAAVAKHANEYDIIHVTAIWQRTGSAACRAATDKGIPYVISPRGALGAYSWRKGRIKKRLYYWIIERRNLQGASGFHYTSRQEAEECTTYRFGKPGLVIPNSIDLTGLHRDQTDRNTWRRQLGCTKSTLLCAYVGRLHDKKGLDLLVEVLGKLSAEQIKLVLVGNDEDGTKARLIQQFNLRKMNKLVHFLPLVAPQELRGIYSAADVLLLPSRHENFGNVAIEAAVCGCHVIASEETGVAETLSALKAGERLPRLVEPWVAAIKSKKVREQPEFEVIERVLKTFSVERTAHLMEGFYQKIAQ
jgi:glycosyltransferase involved in cell wall biosynthesis